MKKFLDTLYTTAITVAVIYLICEIDLMYDAYMWLHDWIEDNTIIEADAVMMFVLAVVAAVAVIAIDRIMVNMRRIKIRVEITPNPAKEKVAKPVKA